MGTFAVEPNPLNSNGLLQCDYVSSEKRRRNYIIYTQINTEMRPAVR